MSHKVPIQSTSTVRLEDLLAMQINLEGLEELLRQLFRNKAQIKYVLAFIQTLHDHICTHLPRAEITIAQPDTRTSNNTYYLPGEFEIIMSKLGNEIFVETFPLPNASPNIGISYVNRKLCLESNRLTLKYIFRLDPPPRNSVSVKPREPSHRDRSPQRQPHSSSSSLSSSSSSSSEEAPSKKKKGLFSSILGL